ncbi:MAG: type II toxin-antitoxin system VapC family toxin [Zoogloeaceae bacterium]|nr:type II toxin-antitoxin system VapC family toxin [Zoogloeaceae bacterium]MCK6383875.1 type II toxin-antitoxin system VapC family toxin [Rhodocyclaceae bacterium]
MRYMLDTNICIYLINKRPAKILDRFHRIEPGDIGVSSVTVAELAYGVVKSGSERNRSALEGFLLPLEIADFDQKAAWKFAEIRSALERAGKPIGPYDLQIAAHALALGCTLVTNNLREFQRVTGLKVENWAK